VEENLLTASAKAVKAGTRSEIELLLCCIRMGGGAARAERVRALLGDEIDWEYLLRLAGRHRLRPLLYWNLNNTCPEEVPAAVFAQLQEHFYSNLARNLQLTAELLRLLGLLEAEGIAAVPLKGPVLAASAYGNLALREFADLDILVQERQVAQARDLLVSQGYRPTKPLSGAEEANYLRVQHHHQLLRARDEIAVELHWAFTEKYFFHVPDPASVWARVVPVPFAGSTILRLALEDWLLTLCVHGSKHLWDRLAWVCDVAEFIRSQRRLNWACLLDRAHALGCRRMLLLGLLLAYDLFGTALPLSVLLEAWDDSAAALAAEVKEQLFQEDRLPPGPDEQRCFHIRVREHLRDRIRYCRYFGEIPGGADRTVMSPLTRCWFHLTMALLPNDRDRAFVPLPAALSFLYYVIRPIRLLGKRLLGLW
jgi:hypothetical protein